MSTLTVIFFIVLFTMLKVISEELKPKAKRHKPESKKEKQKQRQNNLIQRVQMGDKNALKELLKDPQIRIK